MISIVEHIEYLILRNDCVIIPGWGALIAQNAPAYFDMQSGIIIAPSRSISFNSSIKHDDGLIADSVRRKENVTFNEAQNLVNEEVLTLTKQLNLSGEVSLGKLGSFKIKDSVVVFEPYSLTNKQQKFYGLSDLKMSTLDKLQEESNIIVPEPKSVVKSIFSKEILKYAASIILLIGMSFVLTTPISMNQEGAEFASFNVVDVKASAKSEIKKETRNLYLAIPEEKEEPQEKKVVKTTQLEQKKNLDIKNLSKIDNAKYYLIVASLPTKDLAEEHIAQCNNSNLDIIECDGKYRVYIASSNSIRELQTIINNSTVSKKYPGTWICKKK